jgi:hypothetical protein
MVSSASYFVFEDEGTYFAKNGTTGATTTSSASALTLFNSVIDLLPEGGTIFVHEGAYTFATPLYIDNPGIIINGAVGPNTDVFPYDIARGARFIGAITVQAPNVQLNNIGVEGKMTLTSTDAMGAGEVATYFIASNIFVSGGVDIIGLVGGAPYEVPFSITIENSYLAAESPTNCLNLTSPTSAIEHIFIQNSVMVQIGAGSVVHVSGAVWDVVLSKILLNTQGDATAILNLTGGGDENAIRIIDSYIEMNGGTTQVVLSIGSGADAYEIECSFVDLKIYGAVQPRYIVRDASTAAPNTFHFAIFTRLVYFFATYQFYAGGVEPSTYLSFVDCFFHPFGTFQQIHGAYIGKFINCIGIQNRAIANPYSGPNAGISVISWASSYTQNATPTNSTTYVVRDSAVLITSTNGVGVSITIYAPTGQGIVSDLTTLNAYYLPIGYKINFGAFSVAPNVNMFTV